MSLTYYNLRTTPDGTHTITKFDGDINPVATYHGRSPLDCDCPQVRNRKAQCRHIATIYPALRDFANSPVFYCWEANTTLVLHEAVED